MFESSDALATASTSAPPQARHVALAGGDPEAVERIRQWLSAPAGREGYVYRPHRWDPRRGALPPGCDTVLSYYAAPADTEDVIESLLAVLPPGGTWVGLGPLPLDAARSLTDRAGATGVAYLHAPLRHDPALFQRRVLALAYDLPPSADPQKHPRTHQLLTTLTSNIAWMGELRARTSSTWAP